MRLILVRHGQTSSNVRGLLDTGAPGAPLTELGHRQAAAVPEALAQERVDLVYTSTLLRTQQTAAPLASERGLEPVVREGLREVRAGELEMRGDHDAVLAYLEGIYGWADDLDRRMPGGESGTEVLSRYDSVVAEIADAGARTAVLFSHGAAIRFWTAARAANLVPEYATSQEVSNTGAIFLEGTPRRGWEIVAWHNSAIGGPHLDEPARQGPGGETASPEVLDAASE